MSLINDALKKAQRQRTGDTSTDVPVPGGGSRPSVESGRPAAFRLQLLLLGGGALLGLLIATGALFISRREPAPPAKSEPAVSTAGPLVKIEPPAAAPANDAKVSAPEKTVAPVSAPADEPKLVTVKTTPAPEPASSSVPSAETATGAGTLPPLASARMVNACEALRVAGIRASATDSKVLMNDRVYRVGDIVDYELGIKLTAVTASSLTFVDSTGATYTRNF
ncbi:MAG: hypothetical protein C0518_01630 [Opitutus sp.]|nr:hypothetical protein [Opitutus sp.]